MRIRFTDEYKNKHFPTDKKYELNIELQNVDIDEATLKLQLRCKETDELIFEFDSYTLVKGDTLSIGNLNAYLEKDAFD